MNRVRGGLAAVALLVAMVVAQPSVSPAEATSTLSNDQAFVTAAYTDFLGRTPTAGELASATSGPLASSTARSVLVTGLSHSTAWVGATVNALYENTLGRPADAGGLAYWIGQINSGAYTVAQAAAFFYASPEYFAGFGQSDPGTWVTDLYRKILLRTPDSSGLAYWVGQTAIVGRFQVASAFYQSSESRHTRVAALYQSLLGRAPDQAGWDYWSGVILSQGDLSLAASLAVSYEYFTRAVSRFGNPGPTPPSSLTFTRTWATTIGSGRVIALSSPTLATIDTGSPVVIVGDRGGYVDALRLDTGSQVWAASTAGAPVDSTPSIVGSGSNLRIYVGAGNASSPSSGGYFAFNNAGQRVWFVQPQAQPSGGTIGVASGMTVGNFQGTNDVVSGSMGQLAYALGANGTVLSGFPWFEGDSNFATPAAVDLDGDGHDEIVLGGDSTAGNALGNQYSNGGHFRILSWAGGTGAGTPPNGLRCSYDTDQVVQSSPAVGPFLAGNGVGIVAGTGSYWPGASDTGKVIAIDSGCNLRWKANLGGDTSASPALADVWGDGFLEVVAGSRTSPSSGTVAALDGTTGAPVWTTQLPGGVYGGIATADLRGIGRQDVIVATSGGVFVLDGRTGAIIGTVETGIGTQNTVLVTADPGGRAGITVAGYNGNNQGVVAHYQLDGTFSSVVAGANSWPMFHHDRALSGDTTHGF